MKQGYLSCFKNSSISSAVFTWKRRFEIWKATSVECCSGGVENCSIKPQSPAPAQGFCFRMCWTSTSEVLLLAGLWHKCQVTSSAGCIRNEGPCCHVCSEAGSFHFLTAGRCRLWLFLSGKAHWNIHKFLEGDKAQSCYNTHARCAVTPPERLLTMKNGLKASGYWKFH